MPCNMIRTSTINLAKADQATLAKALEGLGLTTFNGYGGRLIFRSQYGYGGSLQGGQLTFDNAVRTRDGQPLTEALVKQAYAGQVVKQAAQKFGWKLQEKGPGQFTATKQG